MGRAWGPAGERRSPAGKPVVRRAVFILGAAVFPLFCLLLPRPAAAQEPPQCLMCHGSADMFQGVPNGRRFVVDSTTFAHSVHGAAGLECTSCHQGITDLPHADSLPPVDCATCHEAEVTQYHRSIHGQAVARGDKLAPRCVDCHGTDGYTAHGIRAHTDSAARTFVMNVPSLCGSCHHEGSPVSRMRDIPQDSILENYSNSLHGDALLRAGLTVTAVCTSCHTAHNILPHTDPRSSISRNNVAKTCMQCHTQIERVHRKVIRGRLWETAPHRIPACVDCHAPHKIRQVFYETQTANRDCLACHGKPSLKGVAFGDSMSLYVDSQTYATSVHGQQAVGCAQCHTEVTASLARPCSTIRSKVDCSVCHAAEVAQYDSSRHGTLAATGDPDAPTCEDCHAKHAELADTVRASPTFARNVPTLCATCHRAGEKAAKRIGAKGSGVVLAYEESIHGKGLLQSGLTVTATCTSCHTAHRELPPDDPRSTVNPANVPSTCGKCHSGIEAQFRHSIHAAGVGKPMGDIPLPSCIDCHTSHKISRTDLANFRLRMLDQCGRCHQAEAGSYFETVHGKVSRLGDLGAAKCYDCHGTHDILPPNDPRSTLSRRNIEQTCSQCHTGVNRRFVGYLTHATHHDPKRYPFLFAAFWAMTSLLVGTMTFASGHTLAWLWRLWRTPELRARHVAARAAARQYQRFDAFTRKLHLTMLLSFFTLALTGMVLKFSDMGWAQRLAGLVGGFATTGVLHRVAALTLITVFLVHLYDVRRKKGRSGLTWRQYLTAPNSLVFNRRDAVELWQSIKWFFGRGPRPRYGRYTYWEKFDYFAVFWGMLIIGSTGLMLWFPEVFTVILPGWLVNVANIIHSDEALLAVAFIFTVHFFNTHFRPDKFPMDPVIFTGHVPLEELKRDKPREYDALVEQEALEEHLVEPYPPQLERIFRVFAYTALAIGLALIALIVYSMLFGYR
jgi:cytochrome b subunit of formate dehydrogenase